MLTPVIILNSSPATLLCRRAPDVGASPTTLAGRGIHCRVGTRRSTFDERRQARRNLRQGLKLQRPRRNRRRCSKLVHSWRCFPLWDHHPSLAAQGGQRRFSYFNIERDNSRYLANDTQSEWAFPGRKDQSMARGKKQ
jgi:hypothetical protein